MGGNVIHKGWCWVENEKVTVKEWVRDSGPLRKWNREVQCVTEQLLSWGGMVLHGRWDAENGRMCVVYRIQWRFNKEEVCLETVVGAFKGA